MDRHDEHKKSKDSETIKITKVTLWKTFSGILAILLIFSIYTGGFGRDAAVPSQPSAAPSPSPSPSPSPTAAVTDMKVLADDDPFLGDENAPVTIVEFSDYECPFCARFYSQTLSQIKENYIETGKVKFVYRDFPLGFHQQAIPAALAANCAGEQGQYFEFHDLIFNNGGSAGKTDVDYKGWAEDLGLDIAEWETCRKDPAQKQEIQQDLADGSAAGIRGTPGFIINGQLVSGAQPFSVFQQIIDAELAK